MTPTTYKRIAFALLSFVILLAALHLFLHGLAFFGDPGRFTLQLLERFNMDGETSVPTWFNTTLYLGIAAASASLAFHVTKRTLKHGWMGCAALFAFLSMDEAASIHELAMEPMQALFNIESGILFFAWIIPGALLVALLLIIGFPFLKKLPKQTRNFFLVGVALVILGAVGVEMISGQYWESQNFVYDMRYRIYNVFEESLEMIGLITILYGVALEERRARLKRPSKRTA